MSRILLVGGSLVRARGQQLRDRGHEVFESTRRSRALGGVRDLVPDLVLFEADERLEADRPVFEELGRDPVTRLVPVILVVPSAAHVVPGLALGATDVVTQDAPSDVFMARVEAALRTKAALDALVADRQRAVLLELAGAVAHRLNQPLTSLSVTAEMLRSDIDRGRLDPELLDRRAAEILEAVGRMSSIIRRVEQVVHYRTVPYVGDVRILDLEELPEGEETRKSGLAHGTSAGAEEDPLVGKARTVKRPTES
jgi:signal transduction histidine kinase